MKIVIGHANFAWYGGTETYMMTVATDLQALGHEVVICSCDGQLGPISMDARGEGLTVVDNIGSLPVEVDATIANDASSAFELAGRFPDAVRIMVAHSDFYPLQWPPQMTGVCDVVVTLNDRVARHISAMANVPRLERLRQPVDVGRFSPAARSVSQLQRVLVLGNYVGGSSAKELEAACRQAGVEVSFAGTPTIVAERPEQVIAEHDAVIGLGRCIVEAMACGRAAYVFGIAGGDGWVTADNYAALEADGFGGLAGTGVVSGPQIAAAFNDWRPDMGVINRRLVGAHHNSLVHARALVELLNSLAEADGSPVGASDDVALSRTASAELARRTRLEHRTWVRFMTAVASLAEARTNLAEATNQRDQALATLDGVTKQRDRALAKLDRVTKQRDRARSRLESVYRSRRYRLAASLASPADALSARRKRRNSGTATGAAGEN